MSEHTVKTMVARIAAIERQAATYRTAGSFYARSACAAEVDRLEMELEQAGFLLGESGQELIVYQATLLLTAEYARLDTTTGQWRSVQDREVA